MKKQSMNKMFSARFWMAVMFSITACIGFMYDKITGESFIGLVVIVVGAYFQKQRKDLGNEEIDSSSSTDIDAHDFTSGKHYTD